MAGGLSLRREASVARLSARVTTLTTRAMLAFALWARTAGGLLRAGNAEAASTPARTAAARTMITMNHAPRRRGDFQRGDTRLLRVLTGRDLHRRRTTRAYPPFGGWGVVARRPRR